MDKDSEFERIAAWINRLNSGVTDAQAHQASTERMVAGAEYELQQLRKRLSLITEEPVKERTASVAHETGADAFNGNLRHPLKRSLWSDLA